MYYTVRCYNAVMGKIECGLCQRSEKYTRLDIKDYNYWGVTLFENQYYLGRSIIFLKRHAGDAFIDTSIDEKNELENIVIPKLTNAISNLYKPDRFNYAALGNEVEHAHWHIIPRYGKPVEFCGMVFEDKNYGKNYAPYDKNFKIDDEILMRIKIDIANTIK